MILCMCCQYQPPTCLNIALKVGHWNYTVIKRKMSFTGMRKVSQKVVPFHNGLITLYCNCQCYILVMKDKFPVQLHNKIMASSKQEKSGFLNDRPNSNTEIGFGLPEDTKF